ncbi:MAG: hypothetical protein R6U15_00960 [Candidatus Izemoplasmatales bacterium]
MNKITKEALKERFEKELWDENAPRESLEENKKRNKIIDEF